jgi:hypothetical protein
VRSSEDRKGAPEDEGRIPKEQEEGGETNEGPGKYRSERTEVPQEGKYLG